MSVHALLACKQETGELTPRLLTQLLKPAPMFTYSKSKGLFAGISLEGTALIERVRLLRFRSSLFFSRCPNGSRRTRTRRSTARPSPRSTSSRTLRRFRLNGRLTNFQSDEQGQGSSTRSRMLSPHPLFSRAYTSSYRPPHCTKRSRRPRASTRLASLITRTAFRMAAPSTPARARVQNLGSEHASVAR